MERVRNAPTLAVVAREAGVSVPTVSKVLRGRADVAATTRDRVIEVLDRLGYPRPSAPANSVKAGSALIDIVLHELDTAWASTLLTAVEREARRRGLGIVVTALSNLSSHTTPSRQWLDQVAARGTCGVLGILVDFSMAQVSYLREQDVPCVVLDPYRQPVPGVTAVRVRNHDAERQATEHLLALGHRRIGVVSGKPRALPAQERLAGFHAAMAAAGCPVDPELVRSGGFQLEGGRTAMRDMLALADPPTAVVFASDKMALGGYQAAAALGRHIPDEVSIVGYDDTSEAATAQPPLTSVRQPVEAMARAGLEIIAGVAPSGVGQDVACDATLTVRASTAPPPPPPIRGTPRQG